MNTIENYIINIPKAELHLHIEGTLEPELMFKIAKRNNIELKYSSANELRKAYHFSKLQDFLDTYYQGVNILIHEQDFYDLTIEYLKKVHSENVLHTEIFFDPQSHTERGIEFKTVITGINNAIVYAKNNFNISTKLIVSFLRHLSEESAIETLNQAIKYKDIITAVGLDSSEIGNPPSKFINVFKQAKQNGFLAVAHAGEEGPTEYIWEAINLLKVDRIDHGNQSLNDDNLVNEIVNKKLALTVCPLSNLKLKVVDNLKKHPLKTMLNKGIITTVNSDDPAYFGGYLNKNYLEIQKALNLSINEITTLARNSFSASFLNDNEKQKMLDKVDAYYLKNKNYC
ncbi:MAG: adenosine deaminase [Ichthyobacteriaceae bacterium]|nr:adenosine deaminase [Ichthyobacteriaceae bacterium]